MKKNAKSNTESNKDAMQNGRSQLSIRCFDFLCALLMLLLSSPFILYGYLKSTFTQTSAFETVYIHSIDEQIIGLIQFSYSSWYQRLPRLFNLLKGDVSILGSQPLFALQKQDKKTNIAKDKNIKAKNPTAKASKNASNKVTKKTCAIKPGLVSIEQMNAATGLGFEQAAKSLDKAHHSLGQYLLALLRLMTVLALTRTFFSKANRHAPMISVFGITLTNWSMSQLLNEILQQCQQKPQTLQQYAFVNADCLNISTQNEPYRQCLQQTKRIFADGIGVRLASLSKAKMLQDNLNGTDMFPRLCELASSNNLSIFMLGGAEGVAKAAATNMQKRFPALNIAGHHSGFFNSESNGEENRRVIEIINQSNADIILVAMGVPKQELWLEANKQELCCAVGFGVGGLFDFYANRIKRAPLWLRQMGFEWCYRLLQEPQRMWKRYIIGNPSFLYRVWRENRQLKKLHIRPQASATKAANGLTRAQLQTELNKATVKNCSVPQFDSKQANLRRAMFNLNRHLGRGCKRLLDILVSSTLLVLLSPLLLCIALLIRCESKGAALFCQPRAGLNNRSFTMWKFRSMYQDAEQRLAELSKSNEMAGGVLFKMKQDPRITLVGRLIRKSSIDELPQLWNVLKGDMSLVGPRPALVSEVKQYKLHHRNRLMVKPGITCIWQVSGRSTIPFEQQVELDIDYIYQQSFTADLLLLLKTIPAVVFARGAY